MLFSKTTFVTLLISILFGFCSIQKPTVSAPEGQPESAENTNNLVTVKRRYVNNTYGFSVVVPQGFTGLRSPAPLPNHGFCISLTPMLEANISVDGSYNAFYWTSLEEALSQEIEFVQPKGAELLTTERNFTHLAKLPAIKAIVKYKTPATNEIRLQEITVALRNSAKKESVVYTILLETSVARYPQDSKTLAQLLQTWKLSPLP